MRNFLFTTLALTGVAGSAGAATIDESIQATHHHVVDADVQAGRRWYTNSDSAGKTFGQQGNQVSAAIRYEILDSGFSVGPTFSYTQFRTRDYAPQAGITSADNYELGLEAKYGYKVNDWLTPYAKANYIAYSKGAIDYVSDGMSGTDNIRTEGVLLSLGVAYALTDKLSVNGEAGYGVEMSHMTGGRMDMPSGSMDMPPKDRVAFNSTSFMIGMGARI